MLRSSCMAQNASSHQAALCVVRQTAPGCLVMRIDL
jgi:hypothetical protein